MANIFPRSANYLPLKIVFCLLVLGGAISAVYWYYLTPEYMRAGYQPIQPVPFSHNIHVTQLGMDCRYCHSYVETLVSLKYTDHPDLHELSHAG